ncbi:transposase family protein [Streptomyces sp. Ag109_O5-1]|uniref:transposase family protein n=1 Tax=Streptomyces sp. Ag109_O5-1 TaxID=1938851 RepID=UPI0037DA1211
MVSKTFEAVLFPGIDVRVESVSVSSDVLVVEAVSIASPGRCPACRKQAGRIHSTYQRALNERPLGPRRVIVRLRVRGYFCDRKNCSRKTLGVAPFKGQAELGICLTGRAEHRIDRFETARSRSGPDQDRLPGSHGSRRCPPGDPVRSPGRAPSRSSCR